MGHDHEPEQFKCVVLQRYKDPLNPSGRRIPKHC